MAIMINPDDYFKDSVGNLILSGDLLRMRHFRSGGKNFYMYKIAKEYRKNKGVEYLHFKDINETAKGGSFDVRQDNQSLLKDMVVVYRSRFYNNPKIDNLKRNTKMRD